MSVTIDGTSGITSPGLNSTGNNTLGDATSDVLNVGNGTIVTDSSGNVGIGVTPSAWGVNNPVIQMGGTNQSSFVGTYATAFGTNTYFDGTNWKYIQTGGVSSLYAQAYGGGHKWYTAPSGTAGNPITFTQAMTLDSSGNLLVGGTAQLADAKLSIYGAGVTGIVTQTTVNVTYNPMVFKNSSGTSVGYIQASSSATTYSTSSDYRLKENIQPMQGALAKVAQLNPVTYNWKSDGSDGQGFIAHELQAVVPDCVTGEKDAVDEEGKPVYQGIDTSFLVATLCKAIQELSAKNDALETRLAALEAK